MPKVKKEYAFIDFAKDVLEQSSTPLTSSEIWKKGTELKLRKVETKAKDPVQTLYNSLWNDVMKKSDSIFFIASQRPIYFGLNSKKELYKTDDIEPDVDEDLDAEERLSRKYLALERQLHKLLVSFVRSEPYFGLCYAKTIYHERSKGSRNKNQYWLHPDIVGISYSFIGSEAGKTSFGDETRALMRTLYHHEDKFFSFEMKYRIDTPNQLRKAFFQAVSNSSWANEGYLVVAQFNESCLEQMRALNNSFGIGLIKLDTDDYRESRVLVYAKPRKELEWTTVDDLLCNSDFSEFLTSVQGDIDHQKIHREDVFDSVFESETDWKKYRRDLKKQMK